MFQGHTLFNFLSLGVLLCTYESLLAELCQIYKHNRVKLTVRRALRSSPTIDLALKEYSRHFSFVLRVDTMKL